MYVILNGNFHLSKLAFYRARSVNHLQCQIEYEWMRITIVYCGDGEYVALQMLLGCNAHQP